MTLILLLYIDSNAVHHEKTAHITLDQETVLLNVSQDSEDQLTIRWDPQSILPTIDPSSYLVDIALYRFNRQSLQLQYFLHVMRNHNNNGTATFSVPESNEIISFDVYPVALRISIGRPTSETSSLINRLVGGPELVAQWTSTLYYVYSPQFMGLCDQWYNRQDVNIGEQIRDRLPPCPPRVDQARTPNSGMTEDSGYWIEKTNRFLHPGAATCFRQSTFTRFTITKSCTHSSNYS